jgi:hypothetical protein
VDFSAFRVELAFTSPTSLTYTAIAPDDTRGPSETVVIRTVPIADDIFLVTWQESDKTTIVHVDDFGRKTIVTNITNPDLSFEQHHGSFVEEPNDPMSAPSFSATSRPCSRLAKFFA